MGAEPRTGGKAVILGKKTLKLPWPLSRIFERKMTSLQLFREIYGGRESNSGVSVNADTALGVATVLSICRVICDGVSQTPWKVYRETERGREPASDHALSELLHRRPNGFQTSFEFRESLMLHLLLNGNAFAFKNRVGSQRQLAELIPIDTRVEVTQNRDLSLTYRVYNREGQYRDFPQDAIWHLRGPSWNGWQGMETVSLAREAIGLSIALERAHSSLHKGGAQISGVLSVEEYIGPDKFAELADWLKEYQIGGSRHGQPLVMDRGAKFTPMAMTGVDAQHLETRRHQIEEICRAFRVMPIMVGLSENNTSYASVEQMFIAHVVHTLAPWLERLEQSADVNLLSPEDRAAGYYTKFSPNALMRGAAADRSEFYSSALGRGGHGTAWMTVNEVRRLEDMPALDDPTADELPKPPAAPATGNRDDGDANADA